MFLSNSSIRRPVAMGALLIALSILGINAYRTIGLEYLPRIDMPYITIVTIYPGGSPEEIETDIAKRIEDAVVAVEGLKTVTSVVMENLCQNLLEFELEVNVDVAANDVREKLDLIIGDFPAGTEKPMVLKYNVNAKPIVTLALSGELTQEALFDYADNQLRDRLSVIPGVAEVQLIGGARREVQVQLNREQLAARGLTTLDVLEVIQKNVRTIPAGRVREGGSEYAVKFDAEYRDVASIGNLEIQNQDGVRTYLRDLGRVVMTTTEHREMARLNGQSAIGVRVVKKADANAVTVVNRIHESLDDIRVNLPGGMRLSWITDDGSFINATVNSTIVNIIQGVALTAAILFFFLYNIRATVIIAVTMPLTIVIGLFGISMLGYTLNISTLMAIGLSVGILVTNSIVVMENIIKRLNDTGDPRESARLGASEIAVAVLASAGTNIVVLLPIAMMGTQVGLFFRPFALTMVMMTFVSLFISFTLTPILCMKLLRPVQINSRTPLARVEQAWNRLFNALTAAYTGTLRFFEHNRVAAILFLVFTTLMFFHALSLTKALGFTFIDEPDRGEIFVKLEYPTRYDLENTAERVRGVEAMMADLPYLTSIFTTIGKVEGMVGQSSQGVYLAQLLLKFPDKTGRELGVKALLALVREKLTHYPDAIVTITVPSGIGGQGSDLELAIAGDDLAILNRLALNGQSKMQALHTVQDVDTNVRLGKPELRVTPNRAVLSDLGVPATGIGLALRANLEGLKAGLFKEGDRNYDIVVTLEEIPGKDQVERFLFPGAPGRPLLLTALTTIEESVAPAQILRRNKRRISKIFANMTPGTPMGEAGTDMLNVLRTEMDVPAGYDYRLVGEYELMQDATSAMAEAGVLAIVLLFLVLAAILESFKRPLIILLTLPLGLIGMLWALYLTGYSISMFVLLGAVMLIGIVVNNAILIMDQAAMYLHRGIPRHEAMVRAAGDRFRPIVMITAAAILGMLPLAVGRGVGSELRNAIGVSSVGGITVSAFLTLLVLPIVFDLFTSNKHAPETGPSQSVPQEDNEPSS